MACATKALSGPAADPALANTEWLRLALASGLSRLVLLSRALRAGCWRLLAASQGTWLVAGPRRQPSTLGRLSTAANFAHEPLALPPAQHRAVDQSFELRTPLHSRRPALPASPCPPHRQPASWTVSDCVALEHCQLSPTRPRELSGAGCGSCSCYSFWSAPGVAGAGVALARRALPFTAASGPRPLYQWLLTGSPTSSSS